DALHGLERDVTGKAVADDDIDFIVKDVPAFDIADEVDERGCELRARRPRQVIALAFLFTIAQNPDARLRYGQNPLGVNRSHETELNQVVRLAVDVRPGI